MAMFIPDSRVLQMTGALAYFIVESFYKFSKAEFAIAVELLNW